jgi:DNA-binding transcriptional ArsR family regulator
MSGVEAMQQSAGVAAVFSALGDARRLQLLTRLCDGQAQSISQLSHGMSLTRQGVTKHLRVLEDAGIVHSRRVGREIRFRIEPGAIDEASAFLDAVSRQWDEALGRLKALVER